MPSQNAAASRLEWLTPMAMTRPRPSAQSMQSATAVSKFRPMSLSNRIPGASAAPRFCMEVSLHRVQTGEPSGRVAKTFGVDAHAVHQTQVKIRERSLPSEHHAPSGLQRSASAADDDRRQIVMDMPVTVVEP